MLAPAPEVTLRPFTPDDIPLLRSWEKDGEVRKWLGTQALTAISSSRTRKVLAIEFTGTAIGYIILDNINWRTGSVEMRVCIGEASLRDRGLGREAIALALQMLRKKPRLKEVYLRVDPMNRRAVRCYERCGFRKEGILRKSSTVPNDLLLMSYRFT
ncbi:MAG: GNAT family N-acetyltransferase [Ignavibacteriales bacterium]